MTLETLKRFLVWYVNSMYEEGDVDELFYRYESPRSNCNDDQLAKMVKSYCVEVKREISKLESYSKLPNIDIKKACRIARSIKARSILLGAENVRKSCMHVIDSCLAFDEESLADVVVCLSFVFKRTKMRFETFLETADKIAEEEKQLGEAQK
ncbi:signal transduction histidine kinase, phosphotransfer (Hpt) domain-containing protein [Artemisia annua]|uniref:Histidine-containing phosphotransfer protein n=1 Tax=Artemisia annua TaxID=35608 RepID=A0A2U1QJ78_ARTAN|nr:signal transduction histidine kinase, phosphotransfer (Hpt) domain-containing protein [Artemisia annua]